MFRLYFLLIGLLIIEGINSHVVPENEIKNENPSDGEETSIDKVPPGKENPQSRKRYSDKLFGDISDSLESVVLAIDTGVKKLMAGKSHPDIVDTIAKSLVDFAKNVDPIYRTKGQAYDIKPEIFHFRSDKPSVMFEINSKSIINVLKDVLQSKVVRKYLDKFSKEAAIIYRAVRKEMDKADEQTQPQLPQRHHRDRIRLT